MAHRRKCKWKGIEYKTKNGTNKRICDLTGEEVFQSYCFKKCEYYEPLPKTKK